jgi:hypothetical protein
MDLTRLLSDLESLKDIVRIGVFVWIKGFMLSDLIRLCKQELPMWQ